MPSRPVIFLTLWISLLLGVSASAGGDDLRVAVTESLSVSLHVEIRNGNITRKVHANGTETRCTFDAFNRKLSENTLTATGAVVSAFDYSQAHGGYPSGYDHVGNVLKVVEQYGHANVEDRTVTNLYDRTYRLKTETIVESGGDTTLTGYDYDNANNRSAKTVTVNGGAATVWTFTLGTFAEGYSSNQIKSVSDGTTTTTFLYDLNGNRSEKQVGGVTTQTYTYDHENRLLQVSGLGSSSLASCVYAYDHRTRRVLRDESLASGQIDVISFAGGLSVQEYQGSATTPAVETIRGSDYGGGIGGVLYTIRGSTRSHNAYNSRGDVVSQTNESAIITWQAAYEAFGTRTQEEGATLDRQKANTKDEDPTGLLNEGMRYRDLEFGIFLTRDPAGFVDGPNVYTYVRQNPWTMFDPLGLQGGPDDPRRSPRFAAQKRAERERWEKQGGWSGLAAGFWAGLGTGTTNTVGFFVRNSPGMLLDAGLSKLTGQESAREEIGGAIESHNQEIVESVGGITGQDPTLPNFGYGQTGGEVFAPGLPALRAGRVLKSGIAAKHVDEVLEVSAREVAEGAAKTQSLTTAQKKLYDRVTHRAGVREAVWERSKAPDGKVYDPSGVEIKPGEPFDLGHIPGHELAPRQKWAADQNWTRKEWLDYQNDPDIYRPEIPRNNQSHINEDPWYDTR